MTKYLISISLVAFIVACSMHSRLTVHQDQSPIFYSMDSSAELTLESNEVNSISLGIYKDGKKYAKYYGEIDKGKGNIPTDQSIFPIASVTKTFTAFIAARAYLEGRLHLDDDIREYLAEPYDNLEQNDRPVLIKDILTHTSGINREQFSTTLARMFSNDVTDRERKLISEYDREQFIRDLRAYELSTVPGSEYHYSGFVGPEILALVLENIYHKSYSELLEEYVLDKAGMKNTSLIVDARDRHHLVNGYTDNNRLVEPMAHPLTGAGGGLTSTIPDMLQYIEFLLNENQAILQEMRKPLYYHDSEDEEYGYFWMVQGDDLMLHNGGTGGSVNWLILLPSMNSGMTVSINYNGDKASDLINTLASYLINDLVNYPTKNAYYSVREYIRDDPDNWIDRYHRLKEDHLDEFNFDDDSLLGDLADELLNKNLLNEAIEVLQLQVSEFPTSALARNNLADGYFRNGQSELSLLHYEKLLELQPENEHAMEMIEKIKNL